MREFVHSDDLALAILLALQIKKSVLVKKFK